LTINSRHDSEIVVSRKAEVVQGAVAQIVKGEILQAGLAACGPEGGFDLFEGLPLAQEHAVRVKSAGLSGKDFLDRLSSPVHPRSCGAIQESKPLGIL